MLLSHYALFIAVATRRAAANVEKVIFTAPDEINIPTTPPTLSSLALNTLTHNNLKLRTHVYAAFPETSSDRGVATWLLLDNLTANQRYEVRVCWSANVCESLAQGQRWSWIGC